MLFNLVMVLFGSPCCLQSAELIVILLCTIYLSNSLATILSPYLVCTPYRVYTLSFIYLVSRVYARIIDFQAQLKGNEPRPINIRPVSSNLTLSGFAQLQPAMTAAAGLQVEIARLTRQLHQISPSSSTPIKAPNIPTLSHASSGSTSSSPSALCGLQPQPVRTAASYEAEIARLTHQLH